MFPAQALAEEMLRRGWRVALSTDARGARYANGFPDDVAIEVVRSATPARGGPLARLAVPVLIGRGVAETVASFRRDRPAVVAGFGGYPSIPALAAALALRVPRVLHEQNGVLGRVNGLFARRVQAVACGTWPTALPAGVDGVRTGNPVRGAVLAREDAPYIAPGDHPTSILVLGGSQGARILSDVVPEALAALPEGIRRNVRVAHQARPEDVDRVEEAYAAAGLRAEVRRFFDDVAERLAEAQLVIARAGASTVADIATVGRPSILVPFAEATGDHQTANARALVAAEAAVMIREARLTADTLREAVELVLADPDGASRMARAAHTLAAPDAARRLADLIETTKDRT